MKVSVTQSINRPPFGGPGKKVLDLHEIKDVFALTTRTGFTKLSYRKKPKSGSSVAAYNYNRPSLLTLPGTWCTHCYARDGARHTNDCVTPEEAYLQLTSQGMYDAIHDDKLLDNFANLREMRAAFDKGTVPKELVEDGWLDSIVQKPGRPAKLVPDKYQTNFMRDHFVVSRGPQKDYLQVKDLETGESRRMRRQGQTSEELSYANAISLQYSDVVDGALRNISVRLNSNGSVELFRAIPGAPLVKLHKEIALRLQECGYDFVVDIDKSPITSIKFEAVVFNNVILDLGEELKDKLQKNLEQKTPGTAEFDYRQRAGTMQFTIEEAQFMANVMIFSGGKVQVDISKHKTKDFNNKEYHYFSFDVNMMRDYVDSILDVIVKSVGSSMDVAPEKNVKPTLNTISNVWPNKACRATRTVRGAKEFQRPAPYSFRGTCPEKYQYLSPGGNKGKDALYYPCCSVLTGPAEKRYKKQLLYGFPDKEEAKKFNIGSPDMGSGIIPSQYLEVGSRAVVKLGEPPVWSTVTLISKSRTGDEFIVEHNNARHVIRRSAFKPESRKFPGFLKMFKRAPEGVKNNSDLIGMLINLGVIETQGFYLEDFPKPETELKYLTVTDIPSLSSATAVAKTTQKGVLCIQWVVKRSEIFIIRDKRAIMFRLAGEYSSESGVGFIDKTGDSLELIAPRQDIASAEVSISVLPRQNGNPMTLMGERRHKGQWVIYSGKKAFVWQEQGDLQIPITIMKEHTVSGSIRPAHHIVGYKKDEWESIGPVRHLRAAKVELEVGKTYLADAQFTQSDTLSTTKPLKILKEVDPVFSSGFVSNLQTYAWEYPVFQRKMINRTLYWKVDEYLIDKDFKKKRFSS